MAVIVFEEEEERGGEERWIDGRMIGWSQLGLGWMVWEEGRRWGMERGSRWLGSFHHNKTTYLPTYYI